MIREPSTMLRITGFPPRVPGSQEEIAQSVGLSSWPKSFVSNLLGRLAHSQLQTSSARTLRAPLDHVALSVCAIDAVSSGHDDAGLAEEDAWWRPPRGFLARFHLGVIVVTCCVSLFVTEMNPQNGSKLSDRIST